VRTHDRDDRDAALQAWKHSDRPDAFLSVKMEEALDLEGELARWQLLCKAPFANTGDSRVAYRLEDGRWDWYFRSALRTVIQACGRIVRSPDDHGVTYLADSSLLDCFDRAASATPDWFADQVDRMERPDLPAFDPEAALAGVSEGPGAGRSDGASVHGRSPDRDGRASERDHARGASGGDHGGGDRRDSGGGDDRGGTREHDRSPVADVWDTE